jgi:hypothetical protein
MITRLGIQKDKAPMTAIPRNQEATLNNSQWLLLLALFALVRPILVFEIMFGVELKLIGTPHRPHPR